MEFVTKLMCEPSFPSPTPSPPPPSPNPQWLEPVLAVDYGARVAFGGTLSNCSTFGGFCSGDSSGGKGSLGFLEGQMGKEVEGPLQRVMVLGSSAGGFLHNGAAGDTASQEPGPGRGLRSTSALGSQ